MLTNVWQQARQASLLLTANQPPPNTQSAAVQWLAADFESRWFGTPALWQPPPIDNTDYKFFDVAGHTQTELIHSLSAADICKAYGPCQPDPANPSGIAWGLEGAAPGGTYLCYSPRSTTLHYRYYVLLPRWSPLALGGVPVALVTKWNALLKLIYVHEAGHVAIDAQDLASLNDQAHQLPSCQALYAFWNDPHVFDKLAADQAAYHARLRADCRPEIGCAPPGWLGW
jgi:predicted secreted Zn-dependent protease